MLLKHTIMCTSVLALLKKDTKSVYRCQNRPRLFPGHQAVSLKYYLKSEQHRF